MMMFSGTLVLDAATGRVPIIGALDCSNPFLDWYQRKGFGSWIDFRYVQ